MEDGLALKIEWIALIVSGNSVYLLHHHTGLLGRQQYCRCFMDRVEPGTGLQGRRLTASTNSGVRGGYGPDSIPDRIRLNRSL